jgi:hypothetical protein
MLDQREQQTELAVRQVDDDLVRTGQLVPDRIEPPVGEAQPAARIGCRGGGAPGLSAQAERMRASSSRGLAGLAMLERSW